MPVRLLLPFALAAGLAAMLPPYRRAPLAPPPGYDFVREDSLSRRLDPRRPDSTLLREVLARRRDRVLRSIPEGVMLVSRSNGPNPAGSSSRFLPVTTTTSST